MRTRRDGQGSHGTNDEQARAYSALVASGEVDPALGAAEPGGGVTG